MVELRGAEAGATAVGKQRGGESEEGTWWAFGKGWIMFSIYASSMAVSCTVFACGSRVSSNVVPEARALHAAAAGGSVRRRSKLDITEGRTCQLAREPVPPKQQRPPQFAGPRALESYITIIIYVPCELLLTLTHVTLTSAMLWSADLSAKQCEAGRDSLPLRRSLLPDLRRKHTLT